MANDLSKLHHRMCFVVAFRHHGTEVGDLNAKLREKYIVFIF